MFSPSGEDKKETAEVKKSARYLSGCQILEEEGYLLYSNVIKKMNHPELNSIIIALEQDNLKHSKIIHQLLMPTSITVLELKKCDGDIVKVWKKMHDCLGGLSVVEYISDDRIPDFLKSLASLENCIYEVYSFFVKSEMLKNFVKGISHFVPITMENLTYIINLMMEDNLKHRQMLLEDVYFFEENKLKNTQNRAPFVKYQNPDAWIS